jgi:hypothetical protein
MDREREERRPRQGGAPVQEVTNNFDADGTTAWWSRPPHLIRAEELDAVSRRIDRAVGVLEVAGHLSAEVRA